MSHPSGDELLALAEEGVRRAKAKGADDVEVYASVQSAARVEFRGRLGEVQETSEGGYSVRLSLGKRIGTAANPGLGPESVERAIERAITNTRGAPADPRFQHYADPQPVTLPPTRVDARVAQPEADRLLADAKSAADGVAGQTDVTYLSFQLAATFVRFGVANGRGLAAWDQDARESFLCEMRVSRGSLHKTTNEFGVERVPISARHDVAGFLSQAAARGRSALDTKPFSGTIDTVLFDPITTMQVTAPFLQNLSTAAAKKEGLVEKLGTRVASDVVTLRDTPHAEAGARSQRVDDEGTPTREMTIIDRGTLRALPTTAYVAHQKGERSTGNGFRNFENRWTGAPRPSFASIDIAAGPKRVDDLIGGLDRAIIVRDFLLGHFTSNQVTGDFSNVAPLAFLVEKGSIVQALPPTTVAGNVFRLMESIEATSSERRTLARGVYPSVLVRGLTCATQ